VEGEIIIDISIDELLKEILPGLTEENIDFDKRHWSKVQSERNIASDLIYDCILLRLIRPKIKKLGYRKFMLCFNFPKKFRGSLLIIIISISRHSKKNITVKTAYDRNVKRKSDC
jgi:hypothetical protein